MNPYPKNRAMPQTIRQLRMGESGPYGPQNAAFSSVAQRLVPPGIRLR